MARHLLCLVLSAAAAPAALAGPSRAVATTSVISSCVADVARGRVEVLTLMPPGSCPGHVDLTAARLKAAAESGVVFAHGYEPFLPRLRAALGGADVVLFPEDGNALLPDRQIALTRRTAAILSERFPAHARAIRMNLARAEREILATGRAVRRLAAPLAGKPVVCNDRLRELLEHLGANVVAVSGRPEDITPAAMAALASTARKAGAVLVVDNLQAGVAGAQHAADIGAAHAVVSNFPAAYPATPTLRETLHDNVRRLVEALGSRR